MDEDPANDGDFDNDEDVKQYREQLKAEQKEIDDSIKILQHQLNLTATNEDFPKQFCLLKTAVAPELYPGYDISFANNSPALPLKVFIIESIYTSHRGRRTATVSENYFVGLLNLKTTYPYTVIKPERLEDKIQDLFTHAELDFAESKKFSNAFYVLTKDKDLLTTILSHKNLEALAEMKDLVLEIIDNQCLFLCSTLSGINQQTAQLFCDGAKLLNRVLNG